MLETTEQVHTPVFLDATISETPQADSPTQDESILTNEIVELWQVHESRQKSIKHETEEFRALRNELGKLLHQMKELLARPGRNGQWSAWLNERAIPRATADRLALKYERSLHPHANCLTEQLAEPAEEEIQKLFAKIFPKLRRVLRTPQSLYRFIDLLTLSFDGTGRRVTEDGILVMKRCQNAMFEEFPAGEIVAEPQTGLTQPEKDLDQQLM
ncbi:MAG: hypothetical protein WB523_16635 [Candidatus Sulfotelmatobacter sp.]